jgi:serine/threonine protein kinase
MNATLYAVLLGSTDEGRRPLAAPHMMTGWMKGITLVLEYLHLQGIVHNDIKSLNILLTRDRAVPKLSDIGEAKEKGIRCTTVLVPSTTAEVVGGRYNQQQQQPPHRHGGSVVYHAPEILVDKNRTVPQSRWACVRSRVVGMRHPPNPIQRSATL